MADWDVVAAELLRKAASVDADVQFRSFALQQQCEKLRNVGQYICSQEKALVREKAAEQEATDALERSLQDAIQRARKVRAQLAADGGGGESSGEEEAKETQPDAEEQKLRHILAVAKATTGGRKPEPVTTDLPTLRLQYPRKLRALESQLEELRLKEQHASMRFAFCCKMSEHLSLSVERRQLIMQQQRRLDAPIARIQTSFPKQEARLGLAYRRLAEFLIEKVGTQSPRFQEVARAPTLSALFPVYHRLKQAKKMLRLLNSEAKALMERAPPSPPKLSPAAVAHRDAMLSKIRRKKPQSSVGVVDNEALLSAVSQTQPHLQVDTELWEKLQTAWVTRSSNTEDKTRAEPLADTYSIAVREILLTELSNAVLWSFKTHFAENLELDPLELQSVMGLVRLVDSIALSQGRTYRSVLAS